MVTTMTDTSNRQKGEESQRRYLAILFSDLSDSSRLAGTMEAEDFSDLLQKLRRAYEDIVPKHGGTIVQIQGDGLLASFGYRRHMRTMVVVRPKQHSTFTTWFEASGLILPGQTCVLQSVSKIPGRLQAASEFLRRKFPVVTVVADGRVYSVEEFAKTMVDVKPHRADLLEQ